MRVKLALEFVLHGVGVGLGVISFIGLMTFTLLIVAQVINRYLLHFEIIWIGDLAMYCFVATIFSAIAFTTHQGAHLAVEFAADKFLGERPKARATYRVAVVVTSIAVLSTFLPGTYRFMLRALKYPEYGTLVRWFNESWLQVLPFVVSVLMLVSLLGISLREFSNLKRELAS